MKVHVWRIDLSSPTNIDRPWFWEIAPPQPRDRRVFMVPVEQTVDRGSATTHAEAVAVGLAALESVTV